MNREIKFRGKRIDTGQWVEGSLIQEDPPLQCFTSELTEPEYLIAKSGFADWNMPRPLTASKVFAQSIGQYTGLKDKNGKEIYEGDVVRNPNGTRREIGWDEHHACFGLKDNNLVHLDGIDHVNCEIIGTIYQNPELIN